MCRATHPAAAINGASLPGVSTGTVIETMEGLSEEVLPRSMTAEWTELTGKSDMIMFGSSYPHWSMAEASSISPGLTDEQRQKILWQNADTLYGLGLGAAVPV